MENRDAGVQAKMRRGSGKLMDSHLLQHTRYYVDTAALLMPRPPIHPDLDRLEAWCGGRPVVRASRHGRHLPVRVALLQPSRDALLWAATRRRARLQQLDLAVDVAVPGTADAEAMHGELRSRLIQRWRRERCYAADVHPEWGATYTSRRRWGAASGAAYADQPSRFDGGACLHIELRLRGAGVLRRKGIELRDLPDIPIPPLIDQYFQIGDMDRAAFGRELQRRGLYSAPHPDASYVGARAFSTIARGYEDAADLQNVSDYLRRIQSRNRSRILRPVPLSLWLCAILHTISDATPTTTKRKRIRL